MKDKEVLQKAIEIAVKNNAMWGELFITTEFNEENKGMKLNKEIQWMKSYIFSHDFAKAFQSSEDISNALTPQKNRFELHKDNGEKFFVNSKDIHAWQYHLQQMVLEENPINYLRKFINTEKTKS